MVQPAVHSCEPIRIYYIVIFKKLEGNPIDLEVGINFKMKKKGFKRCLEHGNSTS